MADVRGRSFIEKVWGRLSSYMRYISLLVSPSVNINGNTYKFRRSLRLGLLRVVSRRHLYERGHDDLYASLLRKKPGAFLDVGANVGQTLLKLIQIDPARQYIGFEPQLSSALNIDMFIKDNRLRNHSILPIGLSDRDTVLEFGSRYADDTTASSNLGARPAHFYHFVTRIVANRGDSIMSALGIDAVSVLKIDVEGAELSVLNGFSNTIGRCQPAVIFECLPKIVRVTGERLSGEVLARREESSRAITAFFDQAGYSLHLLSEDGNANKVASVVSDETEIRNYVALPAGTPLSK